MRSRGNKVGSVTRGWGRARIREPELVNNAPYEGGWLFKIQMSEETDLDNLLTADQYQAQIESE